MRSLPPDTAPAPRLPVADAATVRRYASSLLRAHPKRLGVAVVLFALAALAGLAGPYLVGRMVDAVQHGTTTSTIDHLAVVLLVAVLAQAVLTRASRRVSYVLAEQVFADLREDFLARVVALPLSVVERAGSGDLLSRTTGDVDALARTVRQALPEVLVAVVTTTLTVVVAFVVGPLVMLGALVVVPPLWISTRWYLRRAPAGYLRERGAYSEMTGALTESADAARTVDALRLGPVRSRHHHAVAETSVDAELYTLALRCRWFPVVDLCFALPVVATLALGGVLLQAGLVGLGEVVAVALYCQQLVEPLDTLLSWLDELQVGSSSLARLVGVGEVPPDRQAGPRRPTDQRVDVTDVRFAYTGDRDVLHGVDLAVRPGERLAVVGPSGAGKSTLGRLLAGVHGPRTGAVTVGDVPLLELPLDVLRTEVALVTQEHHVFVGTLADNLRLARLGASDNELTAALTAVDWTGPGLDEVVAGAGRTLTPAQAQQVALARLVLADPHTLVLDEATALLDPRAARHLERSLAAVLRGRTVVAVAHRLHTAHDADRVAVVEGGRITELGSHDELMGRGGSYAALWHSWQGDDA